MQGSQYVTYPVLGKVPRRLGLAHPVKTHPSKRISLAWMGVIRIADPTPVGTPSRAHPGVPATPLSNASPRKGRQPPRTGKKAQAAAEQAKREVYAQQLFTELNRIVFKDGLPKETKLNWNKRLLTTAGRAKWHR